MKKPFSAIIVLLLCGGLQAAKNPPDWLTDPYSQHDPDNYICGIGTGPGLEEAKGQAMADISRYFEIQVTAVLQNNESEATESVKGRSSTTRTSQLNSQVKVASDVNLESVVLAESWTNPKTKQVSVLITLDKLKLRGKYRDRIAASEETLAKYLTTPGDPFKRYGALLKAEKLIPELEADCNFYNALLSSGAMRVSPSQNSASIISLQSAVRQSIVVQVKTSGDPGGNLETALKTAIQKLGFNYGDNTDLVMHVSVTPIETRKLGKQTFVTFEGELSLLRGDEHIYVLKESTKQGDIDENSAAARSLKAITNTLANRFSTGILEYIEGL